MITCCRRLETGLEHVEEIKSVSGGFAHGHVMCREKKKAFLPGERNIYHHLYPLQRFVSMYAYVS